MDREEGFATVPNPWSDAMARAGCSATEYAVVMELCKCLRWDGGRPWSWFPQAAMCERYGWNPTKVKRAVRRLRRHGFLATKAAAHRGRCAEMWLFPAVPWQRPTGAKRGKGIDPAAVDWG